MRCPELCNAGKVLRVVLGRPCSKGGKGGKSGKGGASGKGEQAGKGKATLVMPPPPPPPVVVMPPRGIVIPPLRPPAPVMPPPSMIVPSLSVPPPPPPAVRPTCKPSGPSPPMEAPPPWLLQSQALPAADEPPAPPAVRPTRKLEVAMGKADEDQLLKKAKPSSAGSSIGLLFRADVKEEPMAMVEEVELVKEEQAIDDPYMPEEFAMPVVDDHDGTLR